MSFLIGTLSFLMLAISLFMILLVLIQRGRGGGLAGAFGGMGGQSAFGTRAGDTFTRITIVLAVIWVLLAGGLGMMMRRDAEAAKTGKDDGPFIEGSAADTQDDADTKSKDEDTKIEEQKLNDAAEAKSGDQSQATGTDPAESKTPDAPDADKQEEAQTPEAKPEAPEAETSEAGSEEASSKDAPVDDATPTEEPASTEPKP
jgi:preprotein translocase subunit SecG